MKKFFLILILLSGSAAFGMTNGRSRSNSKENWMTPIDVLNTEMSFKPKFITVDMEGRSARVDKDKSDFVLAYFKVFAQIANKKTIRKAYEDRENKENGESGYEIKFEEFKLINDLGEKAPKDPMYRHDVPYDHVHADPIKAVTGALFIFGTGGLLGYLLGKK